MYDKNMFFEQVIPGSSLAITLTELYSNSEKAFLSTLQVQVKQQLLERVEAPPADLSPSPGISLLLALLRDIVSIASVAEGRQDDITKVGEKPRPCTNKLGCGF